MLQQREKRENEGKMQKNIQESHRLVESLRLEKAFKINKSKYKPDIAQATRNPCPQVPHLQSFVSPAMAWVGEELLNPLRQPQGGTGLECARGGGQHRAPGGLGGVPGVGDNTQHLGDWEVSQPLVGPCMVLQGLFQPQPLQDSLIVGKG